MKIAVLTTSDFPYKGAPESFVRQMAFGLLDQGIDIEIIRFWGDRHSNINNTPIKCSNYLFKKPVKNELLKYFETLMQLLNIPLFIIKRKIFKHDQIILMYGMDRVQFVLPINICCKLFKLKCYRIITEIYPARITAPYWWRSPNILSEKLQIAYFDKYMNGIIVLSRYLYNLCLSNGVPKNRILLVNHFINLGLKEYLHDNKDEKFRIGFCGSPTFENGIIDILTAFKLIEGKIPLCELIIIGKLPTKELNAISSLKLSGSNVVFTGLLSKDEVETQIQKCSVLVNPRKAGILAESGFPTKLGEYFATKNPVIATRVGDLSHYFTDKVELVLVDPDKPEQLSEAIQFVYHNKEKAKIIGMKGYQWAFENLDYIKNSSKLIEFIKIT